MTSTAKGVLYIISCASRPAQQVPELVQAALAAGWHVGVVVTPQATKFINSALLEQLTGYPVRSEYKRPEEPDVLPRADAMHYDVYPRVWGITGRISCLG